MKDVRKKKNAVPEDEENEAESPPPRIKKSSKASDSALLAESTWILKKEERIFFSNIFPYRLDLFQSDSKTQIGFVKENTNRLFKVFVGGTIIGRFFPIKLGVYESDGEPAPFLIRIPGLKFNPMMLLGMKERRVDVITHDNEVICSFVMKFSLTPSFHVYDGENQKIADFKFKTLDMKKGLPPRMILQSLEEEVWGTVTGENEAYITEQLKSGEKKVITTFTTKKYGLLLKVDPNNGNQVISKQMIIAASVAMRLFDVHKIFDNT